MINAGAGTRVEHVLKTVEVDDVDVRLSSNIIQQSYDLWHLWLNFGWFHFEMFGVTLLPKEFKMVGDFEMLLCICSYVTSHMLATHHLQSDDSPVMFDYPPVI